MDIRRKGLQHSIEVRQHQDFFLLSSSRGKILRLHKPPPEIICFSLVACKKAGCVSVDEAGKGRDEEDFLVCCLRGGEAEGVGEVIGVDYCGGLHGAGAVGEEEECKEEEEVEVEVGETRATWWS